MFSRKLEKDYENLKGELSEPTRLLAEGQFEKAVELGNTYLRTNTPFLLDPLGVLPPHEKGAKIPTQEFVQHAQRLAELIQKFQTEVVEKAGTLGGNWIVSQFLRDNPLLQPFELKILFQHYLSGILAQTASQRVHIIAKFWEYLPADTDIQSLLTQSIQIYQIEQRGNQQDALDAGFDHLSKEIGLLRDQMSLSLKNTAKPPRERNGVHEEQIKALLQQQQLLIEQGKLIQEQQKQITALIAQIRLRPAPLRRKKTSPGRS